MPSQVLCEGEAIEYGRTVRASAMGQGGMEGDQHVTSNSGISVDPPGSSYTSLSVKHAELIKAQFLLQATAQRYAGFAGPHDDDRNICVGVFVVSIDDMNGIGDMCHEYVRDMYCR